MRKNLSMLFVLVFCAALLFGCRQNQTDSVSKIWSKEEEVDYTVVAKEDIPPELASEIENQKEQEFRLTYSDGGYLYAARGYGRQPAGSSIQVTRLVRRKEQISFGTMLLGATDDEPQDEKEAYPYLVVKMADSGQNVVFE